MIDADDAFRIRSEEQVERSRPHRTKKRSRRAQAELAHGDSDPREQLALVATNLAAEIRKRPVLAVALAVGIGFALGGALSMRAGRAALAAAGRFALKRIALHEG